MATKQEVRNHLLYGNKGRDAIAYIVARLTSDSKAMEDLLIKNGFGCTHHHTQVMMQFTPTEERNQAVVYENEDGSLFLKTVNPYPKRQGHVSVTWVKNLNTQEVTSCPNHLVETIFSKKHIF